MTLAKLPDLNAIQIFLTLAQTGSMQKTAEQYGLSASAVSQSIASLEKQFGVELFDHKTRPLQLSLGGRQLMQEAEKILKDAWHLTNAIKSTAPENLHLRLGFSESVSHSLAPLICGALLSRVKTFSAFTAMTQRLKEQVEKRQLDILISPESFDNEQSFFREPLLSEQYLLVLPQSEKSIKNLNQLRNLSQRLPYIRYNVDSTDRIQCERVFRKLNIEQNQSIGVEGSFTMVGLVAQGLGWAIMPALGIWQGRKWTEGIQVLPIPGVEIRRTQWIVTPSKGFESLVREIKDKATEAIDSHIVSWLEQAYPGLSNFVEKIKD